MTLSMSNPHKGPNPLRQIAQKTAVSLRSAASTLVGAVAPIVLYELTTKRSKKEAKKLITERIQILLLCNTLLMSFLYFIFSASVSGFIIEGGGSLGRDILGLSFPSSISLGELGKIGTWSSLSSGTN